MIRVASLDAIVASKELANRPKDRDPLPELRRLQRRLANDPASERLDALAPPPEAKGPVLGL